MRLKVPFIEHLYSQWKYSAQQSCKKLTKVVHVVGSPVEYSPVEYSPVEYSPRGVLRGVQVDKEARELARLI